MLNQIEKLLQEKALGNNLLLIFYRHLNVSFFGLRSLRYGSPLQCRSSEVLESFITILEERNTNLQREIEPKKITPLKLKLKKASRGIAASLRYFDINFCYDVVLLLQ